MVIPNAQTSDASLNLRSLLASGLVQRTGSIPPGCSKLINNAIKLRRACDIIQLTASFLQQIRAGLHSVFLATPSHTQTKRQATLRSIVLAAGAFRLRVPRQPKVGHFGVPLVGEEDVSGGKIAMYDVMISKELHAAAYLEPERQLGLKLYTATNGRTPTY